MFVVRKYREHKHDLQFFAMVVAAFMVVITFFWVTVFGNLSKTLNAAGTTSVVVFMIAGLIFIGTVFLPRWEEEMALVARSLIIYSAIPCLVACGLFLAGRTIFGG